MSQTVTILKFSGIDAQGDVIWAAEEQTVPQDGLAVNVFIGQTGTGKTSCIQVLAGGLPTETNGGSHTKHCSIYEVKDEAGAPYLILDTIGLVDTASTNAQRSEHIKELVLFVQANNLRIGKVFFTSPLGGKMMTDAITWITTLIDALGKNHTVSLISCWLCTKYNKDAPSSNKLSKRDMDNPSGLYQTLGKHECRFDIVTHGLDNQADLFDKMEKKESRKRGLDHARMDAHAIHHDLMVKECKSLNETFKKQRTDIANLKTKADFDDEVDKLQTKIDDASRKLEKCGSSSGAEKKRCRDVIKDANDAVRQSRKDLESNSVTRAEKAKHLNTLNGTLQSKLDTLKQREGLIEVFGTIAGVAGDAAASVFGLASTGFKT